MYNEPIEIDDGGKAHLSKQLAGNKWECSVACRKVSDNDAQAIIELIESFNMPIEELREDLDSGCPYMHHVRLRHNECEMSHTEVSKLGHPHPYLVKAIDEASTVTKFGTLCKLVGVDNYTELINEEVKCS